MNIVLTEKREAAVQMASVIDDNIFNNKSYNILNKESRSNGFLKGSNYIFVWAAGHLLRELKPNEIKPEWGIFKPLSTPEDYRMEDLVNHIQKTPDTSNSSKQRQISILKNFSKKTGVSPNEIEKIILATDADAEGEAIGRDMLGLLNIDKPVYRFWNTGSFKSKEAVQKAMNNLEPLSSEKYENLYHSQLARSICDSLTGFKPTKVLTDFYNKKFYTGRVKSVVVSLIGDRLLEIKNFTPSKYYQIIGKKDGLDLNHFFYKDVEDFDDNGEIIIKREKTKNYLTKELVDAAVSEIKETNLCGVIEKNEIRTISSKSRPLPLSGSDFASEMMGKYKISYAQCNKILDYLRSEGFTTYPGTNGRYFSTMDKDEVEVSLNTISAYFGDIHPKFSTNVPIFNNKKAEKQNHTPLSVTEKIPTEEDIKTWENNSLPKIKEGYELIAKRIAVAFLEDDEIEKQHLVISIKDGKYKFEITGQKAIKQGWRSFIDMEIKDSTFSSGDELKEGDQACLDDIEIKESTTKPPQKHTTKSLLDTLLNVSRVVDKLIEESDDPKIIQKYKKVKKLLKNAEGIGTDRTRENIIKDLFENNILAKEGKTEYLILTEHGWEMYWVIPDRLKSVVFTAEWENAFEEIRRGEKEYKDFLKEVDNLLMDEVIPEIIENVGKTVSVGDGGTKKIEDVKCPFCGANILETEHTYKCEKAEYKDGKASGCNFVIFKNQKKVFGRDLKGKEDLLKILSTKITDDSTPSKDAVFIENKNGIYFTPNKEQIVSILWISESLGKCPLCKEGEVEEKQKVYLCSKAKFVKDENGSIKNTGCPFMIIKGNLTKLGGKPLSPAQIKELLDKRKIKVKLMSKAGNNYDAYLTIDTTNKFFTKIEFINDTEEAKVIGECPVCKGKLLEKKTGYSCENNKMKKNENGKYVQIGSCSYFLRKSAFERFGKKTISAKEAAKLCKKGSIVITLKGDKGSYKKVALVDEKWGAKIDFKSNPEQE